MEDTKYYLVTTFLVTKMLIKIEAGKVFCKIDFTSPWFFEHWSQADAFKNKHKDCEISKEEAFLLML